MTKLFLWISAGVMFLSLGLFSPASSDQPVASKSAVTSPSHGEVAPPVAQPAPATSAEELQCAAQSAEPSLPAPTVQAACPSGTAFTCCRCGGCGCRPQNISPTNWCAC
jgi:hypothetical protein